MVLSSLSSLILTSPLWEKISPNRLRWCLIFSAYLCVPLRLGGKQVVRAHLSQKRRGTQRYAEKKFQNKTQPRLLTLREFCTREELSRYHVSKGFLCARNISCTGHSDVYAQSLQMLKNSRIRSISASNSRLNARSRGGEAMYPTSALRSPLFMDRFAQPMTRSRQSKGIA